ncbi:hypothetical protein BH11BAC1_BH11BAC1_19490 [soil metagenome]
MKTRNLYSQFILVAINLLLTCFVSAQVSDWNELGPFTNPYYWGIGRTGSIRFDPDYATNSRIYVGTPMGGLWMRDQTNTNWQLMNTDKLPNIGVADVTVNPNNTSEIFVSTGDQDEELDPNNPSLGSTGTQSRGAFRSTDGGQTWSAYGTWRDLAQIPITGYWDFPSRKIMRKIMYDPSHSGIIFAVLFDYNYVSHQKDGYVYKSIDDGITWDQKLVVAGGHFKDMEFKPGNSNVIYVSGSQSIFKSTDNGETWTDISTNGLPSVAYDVSRIEIGVTPADPNTIWALVTQWPTPGNWYTLYNSTDAGATFTAIYTSSPSSPNWRSCIAVNPNNANDVFFSRGNDVARVYYSGGWVGQSFAGQMHPDVHEMSFTPNTSILYVSCDGGLNKYDVSSGAWSWESDGIAVCQLWSIATAQTNPQKLMCGVQDNGTLLLDPTRYPISGGWNHVLGGDGHECEIDPTDENKLYGTDNLNQNVARADDGYINFSSWINVRPSTNPLAAFSKPILIDTKSPNEIFLGYSEMYKSSSYGSPTNSYSTISSFGLVGNNIQSMTISKTNHDVIYAAFPNTLWNNTEAARVEKVYKTTDGGISWTDITHTLTGISYNSITSIEIDALNPDIVYVGFFGGWVYKVMKGVPNTGGCNPYPYCWSDYSTGLSDVDVYSLISEKGTRTLYAGTTMGIFYRNHLMNQWEPFSDNLPNASIVMMKANYTSNELFAATHGRGAWKSHLACPSQNSLTLSGNSSNDEYDEADQITSTATVANTIFTRYRATDEITLSPDFTAETGSDFEAYIHNCNQPGNSFRRFNPSNSSQENHQMPPSGSENNMSFYLFPNPNTGVFIMEMSEEEIFDKSIFVSDIVGKTVWQSQHNFNNEIKIDISDNPKGIYFVKMNVGDKSVIKKIVLL